MDPLKLKEHIEKVIKDLELDLSPYTVLTEAANGPYCVTSLIAGLAGAKVYAFGKDSKYGTREAVFNELNHFLDVLSIDNIELIDSLNESIISKADIITNSDHLRPLNQDKLQYVKKDCVISLMYEAWEFRDSDLDLNYCRDNRIPVGAINERHKSIGVFDYLGDMAIELMKRSGIDVVGNKFALLCNNDFGPYIVKTIKEKGGDVAILSPDGYDHTKEYDEGMLFLSDRPGNLLSTEFNDAKAIIVAAYPFDQTWVGDKGPVKCAFIKENFKDATILRFAGDVDVESLKENNISFYPSDVEPGHMGILPSDVGIEPIIRLQAGGLKVGQALKENKYSYNNETICQVL